MKNFYFTFGSNHKDRHGNSLGNAYVKIQGNDWMQAREHLFAHRDRYWSMQYTEEEFLPQIEKYQLHEVSITEI